MLTMKAVEWHGADVGKSQIEVDLLQNCLLITITTITGCQGC